MKALKITGIVLAVVIALLAVIGLTGPKNYNVHRDTVIKAPASAVYNTVAHFGNFPKWSPWQHLDPNMKVQLDGTDGTVGAKYSWEGNDKAGSGAMTITKLEQDKTVEQDLHFLKPFESHAATYMNLEPAEGGTKLTWGMKGESDFMSNVFMFFMGGMDKAIGKDYENGLANLKKLVEENAAAAPAYEVLETAWPETKLLATKRQTVTYQQMGSFFETNFTAIGKAIGTAGAKAGAPMGLYYKYDDANMSADMAAAIPVQGKDAKAKGFENITLPAGKAYVVDYHGDYSKMKPAYDAIHAKMKELGIEKSDLFVEEYITDPMTEKDTAKWHTRVYFFAGSNSAAK